MSQLWFDLYFDNMRHYVGLRAEFYKQVLSNTIKKQKIKENNIEKEQRIVELAASRDYWKTLYYESLGCKKIRYETEEQAKEDAKKLTREFRDPISVYLCRKHHDPVYHIYNTRENRRTGRR